MLDRGGEERPGPSRGFGAKAYPSGSEESEASEETVRALRRLADHVPAIVWRADSTGAWEYVSAGWLDVTGTSPARALGHRFLDFIHPDDRTAARSANDAFEKGEPYEAHYRLRDREGRWRWFLSRGRPSGAVGGDGESAGARWVGTATDVTELKEAEAALREADRRKREFLSVLGHELRNPVAALSTAMRMAESAKSPDLSQRMRQVMARQVDLLFGLLDELLDVTRMSEGRIELRKERVDVREVLTRSLQSARDLVEEQGHRVQTSFPDRCVPLHADARRLEQIFVHLLSNAAKYTPRGGEIVFSAEETPGSVIVRVEDTGLGMTAEMIERAFEPFERVSSEIHPNNAGLGIGLSLSRCLVELHGGRIWASSAGLGKGTELQVELPRWTGPDDAPSELPPGAERRPTRPLRVLVAEDNAELADTLRMLLEGDGHQALVVGDGERAISVARRERPDVVLLDIGLPGRDGYSVARALRSTNGLAGTMLIGVSGYRQPKSASAAPFDRYLSRPVDYEALRECLVRQATAPARPRTNGEPDARDEAGER